MKNIKNKISTVFFKAVAISCVLLPIIDPAWAQSFAYSYYNTYTNTANGFQSFYGLGTNIAYSLNNTAMGYQALNSNGNSTGGSNTAIGSSALTKNTTGSNNIALGYQAGYNLTTGSYNIHIGNAGAAGESNTIRIGSSSNTLIAPATSAQTATYIAGIYPRKLTGTVRSVVVDVNGKLGYSTTQTATINALKAQVAAQTATITALQAQLTVQTANLTTIQKALSAQATEIGLLKAKVGL